MYIWILVIILILIYLSSKSKREVIKPTIEIIEERAYYFKTSIFKLEHFDSPHFIDFQDACDVMEANYFRLKQRYSNDQEKVFHIAESWLNYVMALVDLKSARILLDVDMSENSYENFEESSKEPSIIKDEVEKQFKSLLGKEWIPLRMNYFERVKKMKKPNKNQKNAFSFGQVKWQYYYADSKNFNKTQELRSKNNN